MKNNPVLTVGLPFFNDSEFLNYAIQSILNQSFSDFELILINDGSTDSSLEIARSFNDDRIIIISDGENKGLGYRLNQISQISKGKYLARMDADDIMYIDRLKIQFEYLSSNENIDLLGSSAFLINKINRVYGKMSVKKHPLSIEDVNNHRCFIHPTIMGKTIWFKNNQYDSEAIRVEDADLWIRTITTSNFANLNISLLYYRQNSTTDLTKYLKSQKGHRKILRKHCSYKFKLIFFSYFKSLTFYLLTILCLRSVFLKYRSNNMSKESIDYEQEKLNKFIEIMN